MKPSRLICAVLALGLGYSTTAFAQEQTWLKDRRYGEGAGIRTGDLELHPGLGAEFGYDSNYFLRSGTNNPPEPIIPTFRLRITPSFSLSTLSQVRREAEGGAPAEPPKVTFRAGIGASYNEFFATKSQDSEQLKKQRNVGAIGSLQLQILPGRPFGADLGADFLRTVQPSNNPDFNFNRITARFGGGITWAPGGGMFDWRLGYEYGLTHFEDSLFGDLSNHQHGINTRGRWRFLPRTAFLFDGSLTFLRYNTQTPTLSDSDPVRARIGINGLVTSSFALLAMVGWGSSFYKNPLAQQFDSVIGQAELKWYITPNPGLDPAAATLSLSAISLGFSRDFYNSYLGDFYTRNRGYLSFNYFFGGQFLVVVDGGVSAIQYPTLRSPAPVASFTTVFLDPTLFAEYRFSNTLGINTTLRYSANLTDQVVGGDALKWNRFEGFVGLRWFM